MARTVVAVLIGFIAWWVVGACARFLVRVTWPEYALVERAMTFTLPMQLVRLAVAVACSVIGGWTASVVAKGDLRAAWWLGAVLVVVFIPIHYGLWDKFPIWYHLFFLVTLAPINGFSGRLAARSRQC